LATSLLRLKPVYSFVVAGNRLVSEGMQAAPAVSILLVTYNAGQFLRPALESLWQQTFTDFEVVLVDNASSDGSVEALATEPRLRIFRMERNLLQVGGWREGLRYCRGEYVALMDADDLAMPNRLQLQVEFLRGHNDFIAVGAGARKIDVDNRPCGEFFVLTDEAEIRNYAEFACPLLPGAMMLRRETMMRAAVPVFWPQSGDYDLLMRVLELGRVGCVDDVLYLYRQHGGSVSAQRYAEQVAAACLVRLAAARRRAGKSECVAEIEEEMAEWTRCGSAQGAVYVEFARRYRQEGFSRLAILAARRALVRGYFNGLVEMARSLGAPADAAERKFRWKLAISGPVRALNLHPFKASKVACP
jgi:glycosyltransferase involved in cell wall biosynthesis